MLKTKSSDDVAALLAQARTELALATNMHDLLPDRVTNVVKAVEAILRAIEAAK